MTKNNLVTKTYFKTTLDKAFKEQDKKWDERLDKKLNQSLVKNNKKIFSSFADFMQTSIIAILDRIEDRLDTMNSRIDKHDDKLEMHERRLFDHNSRIGNLEKITAP